MPELNPLHSFDLDADDWTRIVAAVKKEGFEEWDGYAPMLVAAVELGYLDNHLQMLARWMKQRYMHLKDTDNLPPLYMNALKNGISTGHGERSERPMNGSSRKIDGTWDNYAMAIEEVNEAGLMIPADGIRPLRTEDSYSLSPGEFATRGYVFSKSDFTGYYFVSPVPFKPLALYRIDKVNRENFAVTCVAHPSSLPSFLGRQKNFRIDAQRKIFQFPAS